MVDARRREHGVLGTDFVVDRTDAQATAPFQDDVELIGSRVAAPGLLLVGLQAEDLADQTGPVEEVDPVGPFAGEPLRLGDADDLHTLPLVGGGADALATRREGFP